MTHTFPMLARLSGYTVALLLWALALKAWAGVTPVAGSCAAADSVRRSSPAFVLPLDTTMSDEQTALGKRLPVASTYAPSVEAHPHGFWQAGSKTIKAPNKPPKPKKKKKKSVPLPFSPTTRIGIFMLIVAAGFTAIAFLVICILLALHLTTSVFFTYMTLTFFIAVLSMLVATILMLAGGLLMKKK